MKISEDLINNDVPAKGQLEESDCVHFHLTENADIKIAFLGNSITRHGKAENLGWYGDCGMAASRKENDYVHKLIGLFARDKKRVSYCVANLSEWEATRDMTLIKTRYAAVKKFNADIIVVRLGENARLGEFSEEFKPCYRSMVRHFAENGGRVVLTDLFWEYAPFDKFVEDFAKEKGFHFVGIHDLGNLSEMKATGQFEHSGVAAHPGDKGMAEIAERIYKKLAENKL